MFFNSFLTLISHHQHNQFLQAGDADYLTFGGHVLYESDYLRSLQWHRIGKDSSLQGRNRMSGGMPESDGSSSSDEDGKGEAPAPATALIKQALQGKGIDNEVINAVLPALMYLEARPSTLKHVTVEDLTDPNLPCKKVSKLDARSVVAAFGMFASLPLSLSLSLCLYVCFCCSTLTP
jgi:hypothetical protein